MAPGRNNSEFTGEEDPEEGLDEPEVIGEYECCDTLRAGTPSETERRHRSAHH